MKGMQLATVWVLGLGRPPRGHAVQRMLPLMMPRHPMGVVTRVPSMEEINPQDPTEAAPQEVGYTPQSRSPW